MILEYKQIDSKNNPNFVAEVNLSKIKPAPNHYLGKDGDERIADLVFQCPLKHGQGTLTAVIVFEHQNGSLKKIPAKLLKYISAIWDAEIKEKKPFCPHRILSCCGQRRNRSKDKSRKWRTLLPNQKAETLWHGAGN